ncbi:MAG: holo-ACP synthase [Alphaproteobacteria bacterium]|nr:holo-ACP synthase [Alphaproteobacteria bacterium]
MIAGMGCDIVNIRRIEKSAAFLTQFQNKILGPEEQAEVAKENIKTEKELACLLAKYYTGKEAFAKALGTGFIDGIFLKDIQILHDKRGKPELHISGNALQYLQKMSASLQTHISLSDDYPFAEAVVIIES